MNGDGRVDFVGTWDGQGVYYRDSITGNWVMMATPADQIAAGDLDGDGTDDLIGIWAGQAGVWVKYSSTRTWAYIGLSARDIAAGKMAGGAWSAGIIALKSWMFPWAGNPTGRDGKLARRIGPGARAAPSCINQSTSFRRNSGRSRAMSQGPVRWGSVRDRKESLADDDNCEISPEVIKRPGRASGLSSPGPRAPASRPRRLGV